MINIRHFVLLELGVVMGLAVVQAPPNLLPDQSDRRLMISHALLSTQLALTNTNYHLMCGLCLFWWVWFCSLLLGPSQFVIVLRLIMSGDVELNPGPLDQGQWLNSGWLESGTHSFCIHCIFCRGSRNSLSSQRHNFWYVFACDIVGSNMPHHCGGFC